MKRNLALLLMLALCLTIFAGMPTSAFSDVLADHRHTSAITYLTEKGVINGYEDGSFKPENTITRAEFVKMLLEFLGLGNIYGEQIVNTGFTDVDAKAMTITSKNEEGKEESNTSYKGQHWASGYIKLAVDKKIVNGYGDGRFGPDDPVKYEEAIKMIVCCLGREEYAQTRAKAIGKDVWPDGYLSIGNDLMVAKNTEYLLGNNASRSNVAQMLYNIKDVPVILAPNINVQGVAGYDPVGPGPYIPGGGIDDNPVDVDVVTGKIAYGMVVAAVQDPEGARNELVIDDNIVIDGQPGGLIGRKYIVLKVETPINGNQYVNFYTDGADLSALLGYRVELKYRINSQAGNSGTRFEIESIEPKETEDLVIKSNQFMREDTDILNQHEEFVHICYTNEEENFEQSLYTADLDTLKIIYNNKVVDVAALGDGDGIDIIKLEDLMPVNGDIKIVNSYDRDDIELIWVNSYETFVVEGRNFSDQIKSITDKFRKEPNSPNPYKLLLDDTERNGVNLVLKRGTSDIEVDKIGPGNVLTVAQSKCSKYVNVLVSSAYSYDKKEVVEVKKNSATEKTEYITIKNGSNNVKCKASDYYNKYVEDKISFEAGDTLTLYVNNNKDNEIIWADVVEPAYSIGYLVRATCVPPEYILNLRILTTDGKFKDFTVANSVRYVTKKTDGYLNGKTPDKIGIGNVATFRTLTHNEIFEALKETAAIINDGKRDAITKKAEVAQPIRFLLSPDNKISSIATYELDVENKFTSQSLTYKKNGEKFSLEGADKFTPHSSAVFVFVPNDRSDEIGYSNTSNYKIGAKSSAAISSKLVDYMNYNIEPFFSVDASTGESLRTMVVVYNQDVDAIPTYRSENILVKSVQPPTTESSTVHVIEGYTALGGSVKTYRTYSPSMYERAYVLDENYERTGVRKTVEPGDIIRVGYRPDGKLLASVEIIYDISEDMKSSAPKSVAISKTSTPLDIDDPNFEFLVSYYSRIGKITSIPQNTPEYVTIEMDGGATSNVFVGASDFTGKNIFMYDWTKDDNPHTPLVDERLISDARMSDLTENDMVYVWQDETLKFKIIYAVRYPVAQP